METQKKLGRPKKEQTPEAIETAKKSIRESKNRYKAKKKIEEALLGAVQVKDLEKVKKAAGLFQFEHFEQLRPLAMKAVKEILDKGSPRDKLAAANIVFQRTDKVTQAVQVSVEVSPVDLSRFLLQPKQQLECVTTEFKCLPDTSTLPDESPQNPPQATQVIENTVLLSD